MTKVESAASEFAPATEHPLDQLKLLAREAKRLKKAGDIDAVIECRIKQLCLQKVLTHLYGFPMFQDLVHAQVVLAEAYAEGAYFNQANEHLTRAREACSGGIHDDAQSQRLQVDLLIAEGVIFSAQDRFDLAERSLSEASRLASEVFGEFSARAARVRTLLGHGARQFERYAEAAEHFEAARQVQEKLAGPAAEETMQLRLSVADALFAAGRHGDALSEQRLTIEMLQESAELPILHTEALSQLARWLESQGREHDAEALESLQTAERILEDHTGKEDPKAVDIKRDVALLHLKLGNHETALQYLQTVEYLERRLHGSQSTHVARTLKALGTVHMVRQHPAEAEQCLRQALRIFEADHQPNTAMIKDIHVKLHTIASAPQA